MLLSEAPGGLREVRSVQTVTLQSWLGRILWIIYGLASALIRNADCSANARSLRRACAELQSQRNPRKDQGDSLGWTSAQPQRGKCSGLGADCGSRGRAGSGAEVDDNGGTKWKRCQLGLHFLQSCKNPGSLAISLGLARNWEGRFRKNQMQRRS